MTRRRKFAFATLAVTLFMVVVEGAARVVENLLDPETLERTDADTENLRVAFFGGSTVVGVPLPEVGFVEQFRVMFEDRFPERGLTVANFGASGLPSAGVVQRLSKNLEKDADVLVVMTGHNEFIHKNMTVVGIEVGDTEAAYALRGALDRLAAVRLLRRAARNIGRRHIETWRLESVSVPEPDVARRVEAYAANIDAILKIARSRRLPVLLCTTAANVADWPPGKPGGAFRYPRDFQMAIQRVQEALADGRTDQALAQTETLLATRPDHPMLRYLRGQALRALGRYAEASVDLQFARDRDPLPRRVLSSMNDIVRERAAAEGVTLVDTDRVFREHLAGDRSAFELFADNCHPTPEGNYLIAGSILEGLERVAQLELHGKAGPQAAPRTRPTLTQVLDRLEFGADSPLRLEYLARNARYCMKIPFFNYAAARRYLNEALELAPERWDFWANHASMSLLSGERERGLSELETAIALNDTTIDPTDRSLTPYLQSALKSAGLRIEGREVVSVSGHR